MLKTVLGLILGLVIVIFLGQAVFEATYKFPQHLNYGVTFSPQYATFLNLDWKEIFINSLDDLKIKEFRIPTYWESIEKQKEQYAFDDVDFMLSEAGKRGAKVLLVIGARQPRWPECHFPSWVIRLSLSERQQETLKFIKKVVEKYKDNPAIWAYQVENEPFLPFFGENCDMGDAKFLKKEIEVVKNITNKPIVISDSGELGSWIVPMKLSDIFGTTLYRDVYNPILGYLRYPVLPYLYNLKSQIVRGLFAQSNKKTIIVELQAEPWMGSKDLVNNAQKQAEFFPIKKLISYIEYAKKTGFDTAYLWGLEWWYFMNQNDHPEYLEYAKSLFLKS